MNLFLTFSDAAKFADVARNFVVGRGWGSSFSFFSPSIFEQLKSPLFDMGIFPLQPLFIALFFRIFGVSDFAVIATSFFFYLLSLVFVFLLARKVFKSNLVGLLSVLAVGFNLNLIDYATSGASESLFIAEIILAFYLLSFKKKIFDVLSLLILILMYFTRAHAFIYIAGSVLFWLLLRFKTKRAIVYFLIIGLVGVLFDKLVLYPLSGRFFIYSVLGGAKYAVVQHDPSWAVSDTLRGLARQSFDFLAIFKKVFYNLYNFYKLMPSILNPYLFIFFVISLFIKEKSKVIGSFKKTAVFIFVFVFLVVAVTIPFYRYLHPVVPLVYILAVGTIVRFLDLGFMIYDLGVNKELFVNLASIFLILFFAVGQSIGVLVLDKRFERRIYNFDKPPVYKLLADFMIENTDENDVILTNLDTWGSWYGERKTVWFPLEPSMIIDPKTGEIPFDAIFLTSYKMNDPNYYMGEGWRVIFKNPDDESKWDCDGCEKISQEFRLRGIYRVLSEEGYEKQEGVGVLLIKRSKDQRLEIED